jgi:hypothetical protein
LKHYYPLDWWCAVLKNATKEEITEKFWPYVKDIVDLPDIKLSKPTWAIVGDRIRAPIDLCYGIGETAHAQLNEFAPYESADDFCKKIVEYRKRRSDAEGNWGRSAINIGTVYTLLVSGVMDSLFDPNTSISERLDEYQKLLKKYTVEGGKKYAKSKTKYPVLDALGRYQVKKSVMPAHSQDIRNLIVADCITRSNDEAYYNYKQWDGAEVNTSDRLVDLNTLKYISAAVEMPQAGFRCGISGYIEDVESFSYQNKTKTAKKFLIDSCGFKAWMVAWPGSDGRFPKEVEELQVGSIIVAVITKTDLTKGFSIRKLDVIRKLPEKEKEEK